MNLESIRTKCAELVGWKSIRFHSGNVNTWFGYSPSDPFPHEDGMVSIPDYTTSSDAALELVAWMAKPENGGWRFSAENNFSARRCWYVHFYKDGGDSEVFVWDDFLPLAVCNAFLKANGIDPRRRYE